MFKVENRVNLKLLTYFWSFKPIYLGIRVKCCFPTVLVPRTHNFLQRISENFELKI